MAPFALDYDPMATDPGRWGHSLGNLAEIVFACLDAAAPRSLVEVGAYAGDVTRMLVAWSAARADGDAGPVRLVSIDPQPQPELEALAAAHPELTLARRTSLQALPELEPADAYIVDGDHNHYTVSEELRLIAEATESFPLVLCHDVCWPHARRDSYYDPSTVPAEHRRPVAEGAYVFPGVTGLHDGGLIYQWPARTEGGPGNGVLTAIEDFLRGREDAVRLAIVPAFFGLGVLWARDAAYSSELEAVLAPWDRNPVLARLEANRVLHLAAWQRDQARAAWSAEDGARKAAFLRRLLGSRTLAVAVALSRLHRRGEPAFSKDEIRELL